MSSDFDRGLELIEEFYFQIRNEYLSDKERAILLGSLENLTYKKMQHKYIELKYYAVKYVSRNLAYDLWRKLTLLARESALFDNNYRVSKKKIWHFVDRLNQKKGEYNTKIIAIPASTMEGQVLCDRYEIEEHLFDCDAGERQYLAIDRYLGNRPCLVIQRSHQTPRVKQQFEREGKSLSSIGKHPQIPELLAYFTEEQHLYLVYEYIAGIALREILTETSQSERQVKELLISLLTVLEFIQENHLTHRNLNPDNIIKVGDKWMVTDFATVKEIDSDRNFITHSTLTRENKGYLAPEQHTGMATFASDIYSIGAIAVRALTGIPPHKLRKYDPQTGNKIWREKVTVSKDFGDAIDRAICYNFRDRFQSASQMLQSLVLSC